ncbi:MAG: hypothetical protein M1816_005628 [Peltula sp. TS41687]|nr:MAG: hypothetical protein M1816_005628 [Peltula sp. TS41687]
MTLRVLNGPQKALEPVISHILGASPVLDRDASPKIRKVELVALQKDLDVLITHVLRSVVNPSEGHVADPYSQGL